MKNPKSVCHLWLQNPDYKIYPGIVLISNCGTCVHWKIPACEKREELLREEEHAS